jgi:hypothetical protein
MLKKTPFLFLLFLTISCTLTIPAAKSFDDKVGTQVAVVYTATALEEDNNNQMGTLEPATSPEITPTIVFSPSPTLNNEDPVKSLGQPNWKDDLNNAENWFYSGSYTSGNTEFYPSNGGIVATSASLKDGDRWYVYYEKKPKNIYIEAEIDISTCRGKDQYGIAFRAPNMEDTTYLYGNTCDGSYNLKLHEPTSSSILIDNTISDSINIGSNQTNLLGVWAKDDRIRLYVNGQFLQEISNASLSNDGYFGLFINAKETPGFTIMLDEISYWLIN